MLLFDLIKKYLTESGVAPDVIERLPGGAIAYGTVRPIKTYVTENQLAPRSSPGVLALARRRGWPIDFIGNTAVTIVEVADQLNRERLLASMYVCTRWCSRGSRCPYDAGAAAVSDRVFL